MQGLKLTLQDIDLFIKQTKFKQQDQLKSIRNIYKQFIQRNEPNFTNVVKRIQTNLKNRTQQSLNDNIYSININEIIEKFKQEELKPIDKQIEQTRGIINKGVGTVQKREFVPSKTQKIEVEEVGERMFMKTCLGIGYQRGRDGGGECFQTRVPVKKYSRESEVSVIKIQRWWRAFRPEKPIYKHQDYFD